MLTDTKARAAKPQAKAYKLKDTHGLYLLVSPSGARLWRYRFKLHGKESMIAWGNTRI
jgi:Arm domain-containing DNA-binding protein